MFAHQVVDDINHMMSICGDSADAIYKENLLKARSNLLQSQKFHMGDFNSLTSPFTNKKQDALFLGFAGQVRLPYPLCWFDFIMKNPQQPAKKRGLLVSCTNDKDTIFGVRLFHVVDQQWLLEPQGYVILVGKEIEEHTGNILPIPLVSHELYEKHKEFYDRQKNEVFADDITALACFLLLLECKNIQTKKEIAPARLNKKRKKQGKQPLFNYHTLFLNLPGDKKESRQYNKTDEHKRIHLCRGHFKEYTKKNPLFGKLTGLYWWQPHVRGQNKDGIVLKDYVRK